MKESENQKRKEPGTKKMFRLLSMYEMLNNDIPLNKGKLSEKFDIDEKTFRRDIEDLREYIHEKNENYELEYNYNKKGYSLTEQPHQWFSNKEILAVSKILLESRGFNKKELNDMLDRLIEQASPIERKNIKNVIGSERLHYVPPRHGVALLDLIWEVSTYIKGFKVIRFKYTRQDKKEVERTVKPVAIIFSEYYFYLIAFFADDSKSFPAVFRLDRCKNIKETGEVFKIPEKLQFEDGLFRKRVQFMYPGDLMTIEFKFWGSSLDAVLDRLPTAEVVRYEGENENKKAIVKAEVYGNGIKMWLLSQMEFVEVIRPVKLRKEIFELLLKINKYYID